ncbi:MAG: glycine zipper 2TM domain-containing protein, partial [Burkholderiales bacterium]
MRNIAVIFGLTSFAAVAAHASDYTDTAKVVSSRPIYQSYTTQECHMVTTTAQPQAQGERQMGGSILGGVAGALLGSQVGQG